MKLWHHNVCSADHSVREVFLREVRVTVVTEVNLITGVTVVHLHTFLIADEDVSARILSLCPPFLIHKGSILLLLLLHSCAHVPDALLSLFFGAFTVAVELILVENPGWPRVQFYVP